MHDSFIMLPLFQEIKYQVSICCEQFELLKDKFCTSESESVDFSAAVTEDYYAEAWVLVWMSANEWRMRNVVGRWKVKEVHVSSGLKTE